MTRILRSTGICALLLGFATGGHVQAASTARIHAPTPLEQGTSCSAAHPPHRPRPSVPRTLEEVLSHCAENQAFYSSLTACIEFWAPALGEEP